jgi:hypothetical protein
VFDYDAENLLRQDLSAIESFEATIEMAVFFDE